MFCSRCGTKNPESSVNCFNCGQSLVNVPDRTPQTKAENLREVQKTPATSPSRSLDPRKNPWKRGDLCKRGSNKAGFVMDHTAEYLEVSWLGDRVVERIPIEDTGDLLRVAHADSLAPGGRTYLETLEARESLSRIRDGINERMKRVKNENEKEGLNRLTRRLAAPNKCKWDDKHTVTLWQLLIEPERVGSIFRIRDRIHRIFCKRHEQIEQLYRQRNAA